MLYDKLKTVKYFDPLSDFKYTVRTYVRSAHKVRFLVLSLRAGPLVRSGPVPSPLTNQAELGVATGAITAFDGKENMLLKTP